MKKKNTLISIVIISLNTKKKFFKSLISAHNQDYSNKEIIVVDGVSEDGTINLIKKNRKKINKLIIEKDKGIYHAMNKGIKIAKGAWIIFLNSGDVFSKQNILKKMSISKHSNFDILYGNTIVYNNNLKYLVESNKISTSSIHIPFCHQSSIVKSKLLKKNPFNLNYKICSDFNFFLKMYLYKKKFKKFKYNICTIEGGGYSDLNRLNVFNENFQILFQNSLVFKNLFKLIFGFLLLVFVQLIKSLLPNVIIQQILKIKYKKNIFK